MNDNYKPIIHQYRRDLATNNIISQPRHEEIIVHPYNSLICLTEIPEEWERVKIINKETNENMSEVYNIEDIKKPNQFYVNYDNRTAYFHPDMRNKLMEITYHGIGAEYFSADSIYTKTDSAGNVIETIQDILDSGDEAKQVIIEIAGISNVVSYLNALKTESEAILDSASEKINKLDEINNNINNYKTDIDNKIKTFEDTTNKNITDFKSEIKTSVDEIKENANNIIEESKEEMNDNMNKNLDYLQNNLDSKFANLGTDVLCQINDIPNKIFPVGYVYQSINPTHPKDLFGGEWDELGVGQVLIGAGTYKDKNGVTKTFTVGQNYGEYEHNQTIYETPFKKSDSEANDYGLQPQGGFANRVPVSKNSSEQKSFNIIQPSTPVYRWVRTKLSEPTVDKLPDLIIEYLLNNTIGTINLADGSVTYEKLSADLRTKISNIDVNKNNISQLKSQFNSIVASAGNDNTEIVSARTNNMGITYDTLGDRLDSMGTQVEKNKYFIDGISNFYTPEMFINLDTDLEKINKCISVAKDGDTIFLNNTYTVEQPILIDKNINFIINGLLISNITSGGAIEFKNLGRGTNIKCNHKVNVKTDNLAMGCSGVIVNNCYNQSIYIASVSNFNYGLKMIAENGKGCVYNNIYLGELCNNLKQICLLGEGNSSLPDSQKSWVNQNTFIGGRIYWTSSLIDRVDNYGIIISNYNEYGYGCNGNVFINTSIEDVGQNNIYSKALLCGGHSNTFISLRVEGSKLFEFTDTSFNNKMIGGVYIRIDNITDKGLRNEFDLTGNGFKKYALPNISSNQFYSGGNKAATEHISTVKGTPAIKAYNTNTSNTNIMEFTESDGETVCFSIGGNGDHMMNKNCRHIYGRYSSPPTSGTWERNTVIWNLYPNINKYVGWVCIQSGTYGTETEPIFKGFGLIEN